MFFIQTLPYYMYRSYIYGKGFHIFRAPIFILKDYTLNSKKKNPTTFDLSVRNPILLFKKKNWSKIQEAYIKALQSSYLHHVIGSFRNNTHYMESLFEAVSWLSCSLCELKYILVNRSM